MGRDRLRRGLSPDRRHEKPAYTSDEVRRIFGKIAKVGESVRGSSLAVKVIPDHGSGQLLGRTVWFDDEGKRHEEDGAWILWGEPKAFFSLSQPKVGDPVVVDFSGNRPADGIARRTGRVGESDTQFNKLQEKGLFRIVAAS